MAATAGLGALIGASAGARAGAGCAEMVMQPAPFRTPGRAARSAAAALLLLLATGAALAACGRGTGGPRGREPAPERDKACADPAKPRAYFYPAEDRTNYAPDDPWKDGCAMLVPDHLFCCPERRTPDALK